MAAISSLFGYLLNWLYETCGNYGLSIIIFSVILRLALIPITVKQQKTMKKSAEMQEKIKVIQKKHKNDPEKMNQETMELYKKEKASPFSGCLGSILQIIIILSVFWLVSRPLTYMKKVDKEIINKYTNEIKEENGGNTAYTEIAIIHQKSEEDPTVFINMDFLGLDLSKVPSQNTGDPTVYIIPAIYVITSFASMKINNKLQSKKAEKKEKEREKEKAEENNEENDETLESMQEMTKSMSYMMPIMSISIAFIAPLGLALYWLVSNVLMIIERLIMEKIFNSKNEDGEKKLIAQKGE